MTIYILTQLTTFSSSELLDQAAKIYRAPLSEEFFRPENARVQYKRWRVLQELGAANEVRSSAMSALQLYRKIHPKDQRMLKDLSLADFDRSIMFWSR